MDAAPPEQPPAPPWTLAAPAASVVRATCQRFLAEAEAAAARLTGASDPEALHDFRVTLRRVRSQLRAYRSLLPRAAAGKMRRALRELSVATGAARDLEVQIAWLEGERQALAPAHRHAADVLLERMRRSEARARREVLEESLTLLLPLRRRLEKRLADDEGSALASMAVAPAPDDAGARFGAATAQRVVDAAADLERRVRLVRRALDEVPAHEARIAAKRLRYLLEPSLELEATPVSAAAHSMIKRLRTLQETLGNLHDAHVMSHVVERALVAVAAADARRAHRRVVNRRAARSGTQSSEARPPTDPGLRRGLLALDRAVCRRRDLHFKRFRQSRRDRAFRTLHVEATQLASLLRAGSGPASP